MSKIEKCLAGVGFFLAFICIVGHAIKIISFLGG
jgi:hypothetical protein